MYRRHSTHFISQILEQAPFLYGFFIILGILFFLWGAYIEGISTYDKKAKAFYATFGEGGSKVFYFVIGTISIVFGVYNIIVAYF